MNWQCPNNAPRADRSTVIAAIVLAVFALIVVPVAYALTNGG